MSIKKNPDPTITCPSCGVENRISSPFCKDCGDRIYKNGMAPSPDNTSGSKKSRGLKAFRSAFNSLIFVLLVAALGLAFWPYADSEVPTGTDPGKQVSSYLKIVEKAIEENRKLPQARISQRNLNAYLGQNNDEDSSKLLGVTFSGNGLELIANEPVGPLNLSTRLVMKPDEDGGSPVITDFWVGHLPLPAALAALWTQSISNRFGLDLDSSLWSRLSIQRVEAKSVYVDFE